VGEVERKRRLQIFELLAESIGHPWLLPQFFILLFANGANPECLPEP
jgi:hypothetical protein